MIITYLHKPFPLLQTAKRKWLIISGVTLFVLVFHAFFQPFGLRTYDLTTKVVVITAFTIISALVLSFNLFVLMRIFPRIFNAEKWNNGRELLWIMWNIITVALVSFYFKTSRGFYPPTFQYLVNILISATAIGIIPATIYLMASRLIFLKNNNEVGEKSPETIVVPLVVDDEVVIMKADRGNGQLNVPRKKILYVMSDHNYVEICVRKGNTSVSKERLRASISRVESVLSEYPEFIRCHRAFIVNTSAIQSLQGNVKSCTAKLAIGDESVPVARQHVSFIKSRMG